MCLVKELLATGLGKAGGYQQDGRGSAEGGGIELGLVDDEVLV